MSNSLAEFYASLPRRAAGSKHDSIGIELGGDLEAIKQFQMKCETWEPAVKGNGDSTLYRLSACGWELAVPEDMQVHLMLTYYCPRLAWVVEEKSVRKCVRNAELHMTNAKGCALPAAKFQDFAPAEAKVREPDDTSPESANKNELRLQLMIKNGMLLTDWIWKDAAKGIKENCLANMVFALRTEAGEQFRLNDFTGEIEFEGRPFWRDDVLVKGYQLHEEDEGAFKNWFSATYKWEVRETALWTALFTVAQLRRYHPLKEYLNGLVWDGEERLARIFVDTLGCDDTRLNREIGKRTVMSACQRIIEPGCKQDHVPMLESGQGFEKSKWVEAFGGQWAATGELQQGNKDTYICLKGNWIVELAEFDGMNTRAHFAWMKSIISTRIDNFRGVYAKTAQKVPRESIFIATINPSSTGEYLKDTENRRFWPVQVRKANIEYLTIWRDQYFAEAMHCLQQGEKWWITDPTILEDARLAQNARRERDVWADLLANWLAARETDGFSALDVYGFLGLNAGQVRSQERNRLYAVLKELGWEPIRTFGGARWIKECDWGSLR